MPWFRCGPLIRALAIWRVSIRPFRKVALVVRVGREVQVVALPPGGDVLIAGFADGLTLGEAAGLAIATHPDFDLTAHLALLLRCGALSSFSLPTEVPS
jgi:hypothetical protein